MSSFYEKNLTTSEITTHYFLGGKEIAFRKGSTLEYLHTDHLGSTSVTSNISGTVIDTVKYFPFGGTRSSTAPLDTDKLFTGQRLDQTGLYFYNARYYDATIGRFISPDSIVPNPANPQSLNRYSYCLNNPLRYTDPSGHVAQTSRPDPRQGVIVDLPPQNADAYVFVGGSCQQDSSDWADVAAGLGVSLNNDFFVHFVPDPDKDYPVRDDYEVGPRMPGIENTINQLEGRSIHIIAFSEGAAATSTLLNQIANGRSNLTPGAISSTMTVTLMECPYGWGRDNGNLIVGWRNGRLNNLPARLAASENGSQIRLLNMRERSSQIQTSRPEGWTSGINYYSINTGSFWDKATKYTPGGVMKMHERPLHDKGSIGYLRRFIRGG